MSGEGSACGCGSPAEHRALVARVDRSFEADRERAVLAMRVATSEALRVRALAPTNGRREAAMREGSNE